MSGRFQFELVTPEKTLVSKQVAMVVVPGGEGDYGVLVGHVEMMTTIRPGIVTVYTDNDRTISEELFVAGGFAEVTPERCTLLIEEVTPVAELDRAAVDTEFKAVTEALPAARSDTERAALETRLAVAEAKRQAMAA